MLEPRTRKRAQQRKVKDGWRSMRLKIGVHEKEVLSHINQQYQLKILFLHVYRHTTNFNFDVYIHGKFA